MLDLILIAESGQYDIAVVMAMDREIAPAIEHLVDKRRDGQLDLMVETVSWSGSIPQDRSLVSDDYRSDVYHRAISENEYSEMLANYKSRLAKPYHLPRHAEKAYLSAPKKRAIRYSEEEEWVPIVEEAIQARQSVDGWVPADRIGTWLKANKPDFDSHNYHNRGSAFKLAETRPDIFDTRKNPACIKLRT